jgi:hypothetical protein
MTPTAVTEAGRKGTATPGAPDRGAAGSPPRKGGSSGHRRKLSVPKLPRRISGPAAGVATPSTPPRPDPAAVPKRSRPSRRHAARRRRSGRSAPSAWPALRASISARLRAFVGSLPDHPLLDRIIRGRAWIPLLGVLLAGIVAMQVEVLKLNASIGRSLDRGTALQSRNELLRANVAYLSDDQRIERLAASMGMIMPGPTQIAFLPPPTGGRVGAAIGNIHPVDPGGFLNITSAKGAVVTTAGALAAMQPSTPGG